MRDTGRGSRWSRARASLVDVEAFVLVVALAAGVRHLDEIVPAERPLHVGVPLHRVRGPVGRIEREWRRELWNLIQVREERIHQDRGGPNRRQRELTIERRHEPRELQLVEIQVVVVDAEAAAHDRAIVEVVRDADSRSEVVQVLLHDPGP